MTAKKTPHCVRVTVLLSLCRATVRYCSASARLHLSASTDRTGHLTSPRRRRSLHASSPTFSHFPRRTDGDAAAGAACVFQASPRLASPAPCPPHYLPLIKKSSKLSYRLSPTLAMRRDGKNLSRGTNRARKLTHSIEKVLLGKKKWREEGDGRAHQPATAAGSPDSIGIPSPPLHCTATDSSRARLALVSPNLTSPGFSDRSDSSSVVADK